MRFRALLSLAIGLAILGTGLGAAAPASAAVSHTLYVDGKNGSDANDGTSWGEAVRSINVAARKVPRGAGKAAGWTVVIRGYDDYVYRERPIPGGFDRGGASGAPLVFQAEGWEAGTSDYVKPIVSGGRVAPSAGNHWTATSTPGVYSTPWSSAPAGFDTRNGAWTAAVFQNVTTSLWQRPSLAHLKAHPGGGYWYDGGARRLYVAAAKGADLRDVQVDVPTENGFLIDGRHGGSWIEVRGFRLRHFAMAVAFVGGTDHSAAVDNEVFANSHLGLHSSGRATSSGFDPATGNSFLRNVGKYNTMQAIKVDAGSQDTVVCDNLISANGMQGIKVQGATDGASDPRKTTGTLVCDNEIWANRFVRPDHKYENASGVTIADGAGSTTLRDNRISRNGIGIHVTQRNSHGLAIRNTRIIGNLVWGNTRFGIDFHDGSFSSSAGSGSALSTKNLYWDNGVGIFVAEGSTNKRFVLETVFDNHTDGIKVGCGCSTRRAGASIERTLVTNNGDFGVRLLPGHRASLFYVGISANADGHISGRPGKSHVNTRGAGYRSMTPGTADFLRIRPASYQYTAGPSDTPIGARW